MGGSAGGAEWRDILCLQGARALSDRSWGYFLPVFVSSVSAIGPSATSSVSVTAMLFAARALAGIILSPLFASAWRADRAVLYLIVENLALVFSGAFLWLFATNSKESFEVGSASFWWLLLSALCMAIEKSASRTQQCNIEKHQVVNAAGTETVALSRANSRLVQIDLAFATISPFLISFLTSKSRFGFLRTIPFLVVSQCVIAVGTLPLVLRVSEAAAKISPDDSRSQEKGPKASSGKSSVPSVRKDNLKSPRLIIFATGLLYFTVVSPGGIFLSWLKDASIDPYWIAFFSSSGQAAGILGSLLVPTIISTCGLGSSAIGLLAFQVVMVTIVALSVNFAPTTVPMASASSGPSNFISLSVSMACVGCVVSRLGLWGVDLSLRQIVQLRTQSNNRVKVFGIQEGLTEFVSLLLYIVVSSNAFEFTTLCAMSACSLALALFCVVLDKNPF